MGVGEAEIQPMTGRRDLLCIVWLEADAPRPHALIGGLAKRGVKVVEVKTAPKVIAELSGQEDGLVVVIHPAKQARWPALHEALSRSLPRVRLWQYAPAGPTQPWRLASLGAPSVQQSDFIQDPPSMTPRPTGARISDTGDDADGRHAVLKIGDPNGWATTEPIVTEEELAMLIGDDLVNTSDREENETTHVEEET